MDNTELLCALELYRQSIDNAEDLSLAEKVWETDSSVSMIFPLGQAQGWDNVRDTFYKKVMVGRFDKRELTVVGTPRIIVRERFAIVEFDWEFHARKREDGSEITTRGRESQVYEKKDGAWRLVHVHYSQRV